MLRLGSLLAALLLLVYLLWGPAQTDQPAESTVSAAEAIEKAPALTGVRESNPLAREQIAEDALEPEVYEEYEIAGYEPVEHGHCTLNLRLFDAHTAQPVASSIQLWRLEVPASNTWSEGDQLQVSFEDPQGVFDFSNLPKGEYRIYSLSARLGASAPPAFRVEGSTTSLDLFVDMPREHRMVLHLYRPDGYPLLSSKAQQLEMRDHGSRYTTLGDPVPDWVRLREPKGPYVRVSERYGAGFMGSSHRSWKRLLPHEDGIFIGTWEEDDRKTESELKRAFRVDGGLAMNVLIHPQGYTSYAAVFLDPSDLQEMLIFPGGDIAQDLTGEFDVSAEAVPIGAREGLPNAPLEISGLDWWDVPVRIYLNPADYETVDFIWRPADGPLPHIELKRRPVPASE